MELILTSNFPESAPRQVVERIKAVGAAPRVAWIAESTEMWRRLFEPSRARFEALGCTDLEYCDIDEDPDPVQIAYVHEFDLIYLHGEDPVRFRRNMLRTGMAGRLRHAAMGGTLIVTSSAGSLLMTPNVSLYRLKTESVDQVMSNWWRFDGTGAVAYEVLPHADRWEAPFLERVLDYSARLDHDIIGVPDGGALFHIGPHTFDYVGEVVRYRKGTVERHGRVPLA